MYWITGTSKGQRRSQAPQAMHSPAWWGSAADYLSYFDPQNTAALSGFNLPGVTGQLSLAAGDTNDASAAKSIAAAEKSVAETYRVIPLYATGQALMLQEGVSDIAFNHVLGCPLLYDAKKDS